MKNTYITTSIAYVNGTPHLGFAMESIIADSLARYGRLRGSDTYFLTGTDEHGIKIFKTAKDKGLSAKALCDENSKKFRDLKELLDLSNDDFIRTSDQERHWPTVQAVWKTLEDNGDIYKKSYSGQYCEGCEVFLGKKELVDGKCVHHKKEPTAIEEENYFFRLSKYSDQILKLIKSNKINIIPSFRKNEILTMLESEGLKDVSFSRPSKSLPWGVPVPGDESQNMYVWCDALTNYISALKSSSNGEEVYSKYWDNGEITHCIGKDIVRFHAGIWIGMLLSAGIKTPENIHIHGFLTSEGHKMSKSIGNVVDPFDVVEKYGVDTLRYYLLREVPTGRDADFSKEHYISLSNAHLSNGLGNLVNRVVVMSNKNGVKPGKTDSLVFRKEVEKIWDDYKVAMNEKDTCKGLQITWQLVDFGNLQMDRLKPWELKKTEPEKFEIIMKEFIELLRHVSYMLSPFLPHTHSRLQNILKFSDIKYFDQIQKWNGDTDWNELGESEILFEKIEYDKSSS